MSPAPEVIVVTEESLFLAALDRPERGRPAEVPRRRLRRDSDLRKRIDVLLAAFDAGKDKLEPPADGEERSRRCRAIR